MWQCLVGIIALAAAVTAQAADPLVTAACTPSVQVKSLAYPGMDKIISTNNLASSRGKALSAPGQLVRFSGRLLDKNCVPVSEAKIDLWHASPLGQVDYASRAELATPDAVFNGGGRAVTDTNGFFEFTTVYPGRLERTVTRTNAAGKPYTVKIIRAPHFNLRVSHAEHPTFQTSFYFEAEPDNEVDEVLKKLKPATRDSVIMPRLQPRSADDDVLYVFQRDVVLDSASHFKRF